VSLDQSKHRHPLTGWCGFLFPRVSLDPQKFTREPYAPVVYFMRREVRARRSGTLVDG
jgi:hypothetical protein